MFDFFGTAPDVEAAGVQPIIRVPSVNRMNPIGFMGTDLSKQAIQEDFKDNTALRSSHP